MENSNSKILVVDLDRTLIKVDLFHECISYLLLNNFFYLIKCIPLATQGLAKFKTALFSKFTFTPGHLPYNISVVEWLKLKKSQGYSIILATASCEAQSRKIADHLQFFDAVHGSSCSLNLKGKNKSNLLKDKYINFEYLGDSLVDLYVWRSASVTHISSTNPFLIKKLSSYNKMGHIFTQDNKYSVANFLKLLRFSQWVKNFLRFLPLITSQTIFNIQSFKLSILAFFLFSVVASCGYLINDLRDLDGDRINPNKRTRPLASGLFGVTSSWLFLSLFLTLSLYISIIYMPNIFTFCLLLYFTISVTYSLFIKELAIIDLISLAFLYTLRIISGAFAIGVTVSFWLLAFSMFFFLSLGLIKRCTELLLFKSDDYLITSSRRGYLYKDFNILSSMGISTGYISILVMALYIQDPVTSVLYRSPYWIWLVCIALFFWISRAWLITSRGLMNSDPVYFALKDRISIFTLTIIIIAFLLAY